METNTTEASVTTEDMIDTLREEVRVIQNSDFNHSAKAVTEPAALHRIRVFEGIIAILERKSPRYELIEWIPVTESLPDDGITMLILLKDGEASTGYYDSEYKEWKSVEHDAPFPDTVTHYADLPAGPQSDH